MIGGVRLEAAERRRPARRTRGRRRPRRRGCTSPCRSAISMSARRTGVGIDRAGRVVRVDDDQRPRARRDERLEVLEIRQPPVAPDRSGSSSPRRRSWRAPRCTAGRSATAPARRRPGSTSAVSASSMPSDVPAVMSTRSGWAGKPMPRPVARDGLPRLRDAWRRHVAVVPVPHRLERAPPRRPAAAEPERDRIADVQVPHASARRPRPCGPPRRCCGSRR